ASYEYQQRVDRGEEVVVGVNEYRTEGEPDTEILKVDDEVSEKQLDRLERVKAERDDDAVEETLDALSDAIESDENVMPYVIDAVKTYATMGEIMSVFETHHGQYSERIGLA
ncbi:MAG: methylmalonyl-CoA mutase family protein, partial [Haloarculaceae archaeon]